MTTERIVLDGDERLMIDPEMTLAHAAQNRHQDAVHGDVVQEGEEPLVRQGRQLQDRLVGRPAGLLGGRARRQAARGAVVVAIVGAGKHTVEKAASARR